MPATPNIDAIVHAILPPYELTPCGIPFEGAVTATVHPESVTCDECKAAIA